jgi:glycosyltransferase involved in cell wall biosynthesis
VEVHREQQVALSREQRHQPLPAQHSRDVADDDTQKIAEQSGAKVIVGEWEVEGERRCVAMENCCGEWILEIDADERVSGDLAQEIKQTIQQAKADFYRILPADTPLKTHLYHHQAFPPLLESMSTNTYALSDMSCHFFSLPAHW